MNLLETPVPKHLLDMAFRLFYDLNVSRDDIDYDSRLADIKYATDKWVMRAEASNGNDVDDISDEISQKILDVLEETWLIPGNIEFKRLAVNYYMHVPEVLPLLHCVALALANNGFRIALLKSGFNKNGLIHFKKKYLNQDISGKSAKEVKILTKLMLKELNLENSWDLMVELGILKHTARGYKVVEDCAPHIENRTKLAILEQAVDGLERKFKPDDKMSERDKAFTCMHFLQLH